MPSKSWAILVAVVSEVHRFADADRLCSWAGLTPRPRVRHRRPSRSRHQTGQQAGALGRGGGDPAQDHPQDHRGPGTDRCLARPEHRQDRRGTQAAHAGLLRLRDGEIRALARQAA
ncbi:transposase [Streptomyces himalayensis]|uniref:transposase n=1 Tax=Streptomyces himalayensis TaxID=2820085 RepID=UPI0035A90000